MAKHTDRYQNDNLINLAKNKYEEKNRGTIPSEIITLTSEGKIYPHSSLLSSGKIEMRYMTAYDEDILTNASCSINSENSGLSDKPSVLCLKDDGKNLFDWMSRIDGKLWSNKPMLLMATSPGARGGATGLEIAQGRFGYMGGNIVGSFSLPSFGDNFSPVSSVK